MEEEHLFIKVRKLKTLAIDIGEEIGNQKYFICDSRSDIADISNRLYKSLNDLKDLINDRGNNLIFRLVVFTLFVLFFIVLIKNYYSYG